MAERHQVGTYEAYPDRPAEWWTDRASWGAIIAGSAVALVVMLLLGTLGLAIGFSVVDPGEDQNAFSGLGIGAGIWWLISTLISLFAGGWTAGRLAGAPLRTSGMLHGLVVWAVVTLVSLWLIGSAAGSLLSGAYSVLETTIGGAASAVQAVAPEDVGIGDITGDTSWEEIRGDAEQLLGPLADPQQRQELMGHLERAIRGDGNTQQARQELADYLARNSDLSPIQARQRVDRWVGQYQRLERRVTETYEEVTTRAVEASGEAMDVMAVAAWWSFANLLLGGIAAVVGGIAGKPEGRERV